MSRDQHSSDMDTACMAVAICVASYFAIRWTLRDCFPPDTKANETN